MTFQLRHINRYHFPQKHIMVCEDDLDNQIIITKKLKEIFPNQGLIDFNFVSGGIAAASILNNLPHIAILLDHDMPYGNGADLITWMKENNRITPIITFSGIDYNNDNMEMMLKQYNMPYHKFSKYEVFDGKADDVLRKLGE